MTERPKITKEIKILAAKKIIDDLGKEYTGADAEALAYAYRGGYMDGFELGKKLDDLGWDISAPDIEILDCMHSVIDKEHEKVCKKWFEDNDIQPPLKIGTEIKQGVIIGIYDYRVGRYLVKENGCKDENRSLVINFEDAEVAA